MPLQSSPVSIDAMSNQTKIWAFILGPILAVIVYYLMPGTPPARPSLSRTPAKPAPPSQR